MINNAGVSKTPGERKINVERILSHWKQHDTLSPSSLELPFDFRRSPGNSISATNFSSTIPKFISEEFHKLRLTRKYELSDLFLAAFLVLLYRYTNQPCMVVRVINSELFTTFHESGRLIPTKFKEIFLQTDLTDGPEFIDLLTRVHDIFCGNDDNNVESFRTLIDDISTASVQRDQIFQIAFDFRKPGEGGHRSDASSMPDTAKSDIWLSIEETQQDVTARWHYNANLFKEATIKRLSDHFQNLLIGIVENPNQSIWKLPLLSAQERLRILFEWNDTSDEFPLDKCLHELFEHQVSLNPDAVAVESFEKGDNHSHTVSNNFSFHQLNCRSNQVARYLCDLGVGPGVLVGVCVRRSYDMIVALLGVLKAGGAYVPLDTAYPAERLQFMLGDSGVAVLLTQNDILKSIPLQCSQLVCLDKDSEKIGKYSTENLNVKVEAENLAYVIYTSGSTGTPKGTLIVHRGVVNYLCWCIKEYDVANGSGAPVNSSIAFDATVTSVFSPLITGKRILLLPEKDEIEALRTVLVSGRDLSLIKITPAHLDMLQHLLPPGRLKNTVRVIVIGGESLTYRSLAPWLKNASDTRLINEYGPTETVVGCCVYQVPFNPPDSGDVPIGRPISNMQMYILDREMEPVPIGVAGEIYIGGVGVALGYLNRPDLTKERFLPNPFNEDNHGCLYKTGDLGRYLDDGTIIFLGRIDQQVKIRGYRIELAEIEATLLKHPGITQAAVIARNDHDEKRLVAYVVTREKALNTNVLRSFLSNILPGYMIPSSFVFLMNLPLTPNGKVDRKALPVPDHENARLVNSYTAPRTKLEVQLTEIFKKGLNIEKIGITEDFFELGGSSIRAAEIFSKIGKATRKQFPISTLIANPTIEKLALFIASDHRDGSSLVPIQTLGTKPPLFCVHGGWGHVLFYRHLAKHLGTDQPLYALEAKGLNGNQKPTDDLVKMAADYIYEMRSVQPTGPYYLAGYCFGAIVAFEMARQLLVAGDRIAFVGSFNGIAPKVAQISKPGFAKKAVQLTTSNKRYFLLRLKKVVKIYLIVRWYRLLVKIRSLTYKYLSKFGLPLPHALRRWHIFDAISKALKTYNPQPFPGQLTIFRSPGIFKSPDLGWSPLIKGGITTYDIPGDHKDRTRIMYEPFVPMLAEAVKKQLSECAFITPNDRSSPQGMTKEAITLDE